jgi:predicted amidohydrolase
MLLLLLLTVSVQGTLLTYQCETVLYWHGYLLGTERAVAATARGLENVLYHLQRAHQDHQQLWWHGLHHCVDPIGSTSNIEPCILRCMHRPRLPIAMVLASVTKLLRAIQSNPIPLQATAVRDGQNHLHLS